MTRVWAVAVLGWALAAGAAGAVSPNPGDLVVGPEELSRARALVRQLGSEVFREREQAHAALAKMGRLARPALVEALNTDPNPEVRARAARLLPRAQAADLQARVDTFLADSAGKYEHDLPAWDLFRKHVGADAAARALYVEMLKSQPNRELLVALDGSPEEAGRAVADRRLSLYLDMNPNAFGGRLGVVNPATKPRPPELADIALLLFAETAVPGKDVPRPGPFVFVTGAAFVQQQAAMKAVNDPNNTPHARPYRDILVKWLDTRTTPEDLNNIAYVAQNLRTIKETTPLLRRVVSTEGVQGHAKGQALMFLVQRGGKEEQPFLKSLVKDDTLVTTVFLGNNAMGQPNQASCLLGDVALAMLVTQTGQDLKAYGYSFPPGVNLNGQNIGYGSYAFTSDEKRAAALKKWAEWEAKQKKDDQKK